MKSIKSYQLFLFLYFLLPLAHAQECGFDKTFSSDTITFRVTADEKRCVLQKARITALKNNEQVSSVTMRGDPIREAWIADLDDDGHAEIVIETASVDEEAYAEVQVYEWMKSHFFTYLLPTLTREELVGYRGRDQFKVREDEIAHTFPIYQEHDKNCCPSGGTRQLIYQLQEDGLALVRDKILQ